MYHLLGGFPTAGAAVAPLYTQGYRGLTRCSHLLEVSRPGGEPPQKPQPSPGTLGAEEWAPPKPRNSPGQAPPLRPGRFPALTPGQPHWLGSWRPAGPRLPEDTQWGHPPLGAGPSHSPPLLSRPPPPSTVSLPAASVPPDGQRGLCPASLRGLIPPPDTRAAAS